MAADKTKLCIERYWEVVGGLSVGVNTSLTPRKLGISKLHEKITAQTVADGATL